MTKKGQACFTVANGVPLQSRKDAYTRPWLIEAFHWPNHQMYSIAYLVPLIELQDFCGIVANDSLVHDDELCGIYCRIISRFGGDAFGMPSLLVTVFFAGSMQFAFSSQQLCFGERKDIRMLGLGKRKS